jgi:hypothetical protein
LEEFEILEFSRELSKLLFMFKEFNLFEELGGG